MAFCHIYLNCSFLLLIYFSVHICCLFCNLQRFAYAIVIWFMSCNISQYCMYMWECVYRNACYSFLLFTSLFLHDLCPYFNDMLFYKSHALIRGCSVLRRELLPIIPITSVLADFSSYYYIFNKGCLLLRMHVSYELQTNTIAKSMIVEILL